jgi:hypothetical protein
LQIKRRSLVPVALDSISGCVSRLMNACDHGETFDTLAIARSGDTMVAVGREFDDVLTPPRPLVAALHSELRAGLSAEFLNVELNSNTELRGKSRLVLASIGSKASTAVA